MGPNGVDRRFAESAAEPDIRPPSDDEGYSRLMVEHQRTQSIVAGLAGEVQQLSGVVAGLHDEMNALRCELRSCCGEDATHVRIEQWCEELQNVQDKMLAVWDEASKRMRKVSRSS